ncbi:MAG: acyltransferase family protein [Vicinamibacterales bacterium]
MPLATADAAGGFPRARVPALDGVRAIAILMVVACHVQVFLRPLSGPLAYFCSEVAWCGVYLFFVLSGYLIGTLALSEVDATGSLRIRAFWARRALRTWPLYVAALIANVVWAAPDATPAPGLWSYLTFTQGFFTMNYFIESWTLSVEELFYFVLPVFVLIVLRLAGRRGMAIGCLLCVAASWLVRRRTGYLVHPATTFDSLMLGVLVAETERSRHVVFDVLRRWAFPTLVAGLAVLVVCFGRGGPAWSRQFQGYVAIGFVLVLVSALNPAALASRLLATRAFTMIAWSSYSTYLTHMFVIRLLVSGGLADAPPSTATAFGVFLLATAACLGCGWLIYEWVEAPGLRIRERLVPRRSWRPNGAALADVASARSVGPEPMASAG